MRIAQLEIESFRGIAKGTISFPSHSVLLGANNVGKTTVAEGLALLVGREALTKPLSDWDFHGGKPKGDSRFFLIATITDFGDGTKNDPSAFPDWFIGENAAVPVWWDEIKLTTSHEPDPPQGTRLAARIAVAGHYVEDSCEFEAVRFFYDGPCDPFVDDVHRVPNQLLRDLGVFFLPGDRQWDKLLAFGSSSFLKVLREYDAIPGSSVEKLKSQLRTAVEKIEEAAPLKDVIATAEKELRSFLMLSDAGKLVYRPTSLDTISVLRSLFPHMFHGGDVLIPVERSGSGLIALQSFVLLLAFSQQRLKEHRNFILVADEPELHLHPSLHRRLVNRIRASSTQSIVMTQSPGVAAGYQPNEAVFLQKSGADLTASRLRNDPIATIQRNAVEKLYLDNRHEFYDALMGSVLIVPEGKWDWHWLTLWQRVAEVGATKIEFCPVSLVPTSDASVVETFKEIIRIRPDAVPMIDGDAAGKGYLTSFVGLTAPPKRIIQLGNDAGMECLSAWILEPALKQPTPTLAALLPNAADRTLKGLQDALIANKKDSELHENLAWEVAAVGDCMARASELFCDLAAISADTSLSNAGWQKTNPAAATTLYQSTHIVRG